MVGELVVTSLGEEQARRSEWGGTGSFVRICATVVTPGPAMSPALVVLQASGGYKGKYVLQRT